MIAVDTSALMATLLHGPMAQQCILALREHSELIVSAATLAEAYIVASGRNVADGMSNLIDELEFEIVPVTAAMARRVKAIHAAWGKGRHPAGLNFGDCFAYAVAKSHKCPLLYVGDDSRKTDVLSVL